MKRPKHEELMSLVDIARAAKVSRTTVWRWCKKGRLGPINTKNWKNGNILIHHTQVKKLLDERAKELCRR